jgi:hypothetical protein
MAVRAGQSPGHPTHAPASTQPGECAYSMPTACRCSALAVAPIGADGSSTLLVVQDLERIAQRRKAGVVL